MTRLSAPDKTVAAVSEPLNPVAVYVSAGSDVPYTLDFASALTVSVALLIVTAMLSPCTSAWFASPLYSTLTVYGPAAVADGIVVEYALAVLSLYWIV